MSTLNIGSSGSTHPYAKYNSKSDKWYVKNESGEIEIEKPTFAVDFENVQTGWVRRREGEAPVWRIDPSLEERAPSPGEGFQRVVVFNAYSDHFFGGKVQISSTSIHFCNAIKEVYVIFVDERHDHPGQVMVAACTGSQPMKGQFGTNHKPIFERKKWIDRPDGLPDESPVDPADVWQGDNDDGISSKSVPVEPPAKKIDETQPEF